MKRMEKKSIAKKMVCFFECVLGFSFKRLMNVCDVVKYCEFPFQKNKLF